MKELAESDTSALSIRSAGWTPKYHRHMRDWLIEYKKNLPQKPLKPVMKEFKLLLEMNPLIRMSMNKMIKQVHSYFADHHRENYHNAYVKDIDELILLINDTLDRAPEFDNSELVGCPINVILDWCMFTPAGCAVFANPQVNDIFRKILQTWKRFLDSAESRYVLNESKKGWQCSDALRSLKMDDYQYDRNDKYWGFHSWNDFFTRRLAPDARKIESPQDGKVVISCCDSTVYKIARQVKGVDDFWIKEQPYSLRDMVAGSWDYNYFVGGDVYQAFLSALDYHRWHSPISGTIKKIHNQPGTYYSEAESEGADPGGPDKSQAYISHVATRTLIYIESDEPTIGIVCIIFIGMAEISSCEPTYNLSEGDRVTKGQDIGCFKYGGSTFCMLFKEGAINTFEVKTHAKLEMGTAVAKAF